MQSGYSGWLCVCRKRCLLRKQMIPYGRGGGVCRGNLTARGKDSVRDGKCAALTGTSACFHPEKV
ncbi:MAG: hypothetical protein LUG54_08460, partial [Clostridiales bacterium]|nr:hypothetical protein [Clostridiales bacterium]